METILILKKGGLLLPLVSIGIQKSKIVLGFLGLFFFLLSFLSSGLGTIAFISIGIAYMLPFIMNIFIARSCGLYSTGIIQTNEIVKFIDIERVIVKEQDLVFVNKKTGAKLLRFNNNEGKEIKKHLLKNNKDMIIEE